MLRATLNEAVPLQVLAADGKTDLYAQAFVYRDGVLLTTLPLPHLDAGLYGVSYTASQEGYLSVVYKLFYDSGFTVPADYEYEAEVLEVSSDKTNILRLLGLMHHKAVLDQQMFDGAGNLTSARLRAYDTQAHADLAGLTGLLFTWQVAALYTSGRVSDFRIKEAP